MTSQLFLEFPDTKNLKTLRITDGSFYNPKIKVECGLLEVTPPGVTNALLFNVDKNFSLVLNSSNLKLAKTKVYSKLQALPDGIYKIKYSIKPNPDLWIEYEYLRIDRLVKDYNEQLCKLKLQTCIPDKETHALLKQLRDIRIYFDVAKVEVEDCGNRSRGIELYNYAQKLLNKFKTTDCLTC